MTNLTSRWPLGLNSRNWPLFAVGFVVLLAIVVGFDVSLSQGAIHWPDAWRQPFFVITDYGLSDWVLIPSLIVLLLSLAAGTALRGQGRLVALEVRLYSAFILLGVGLPGLASNLIKRIIGRGRPVLFDEMGAFNFQNVLNDWTHQSFPSGHATTAMALAFVVGFLAPRLFVPFLVIAIAVGISRVPVGAHYPTDVLGGMVVGTLGAYAVRNFFASKEWIFKRAPDGTIQRQPMEALPRLFQRARP
ncbi:phosphatase PAP2 family protein [Devosia rhodophyticola]|uniref:Phosphatase PAP2 family protein n=1 Tax=Devosia rhodophyticola TaxID=3026423 RepID=A0ABY7YX25_9HYPH|nr:phosphatase PAP2 family protein [Devosia rhodophyticola]WDR05575.1 phosphatase PAP2 family protein [Devosia rhodophyticola]